MEALLSPTIQRLLDYFAHTASDEEILAFQLSEVEQERIRDLLERASEGSLSVSERTELDQLASLDEEISLLKTRARQRLRDK